MSETFEHKGFTFGLEIERDCDMSPPWEECDGHGEVSGWTSRDKTPGERVLNQDRGSKRYYDVQQTIKMAKKEGWGLCAEGMLALETKLGRKPTKGEVAAASVEADFQYLRAWCEDKWHYAVLHVTLEVDGQTYDSYLGGVEYWPCGTPEQEGYYMEQATEMAEELIHEYIKANSFFHRQDLCSTMPLFA